MADHLIGSSALMTLKSSEAFPDPSPVFWRDRPRGRVLLVQHLHVRDAARARSWLLRSASELAPGARLAIRPDPAPRHGVALQLIIFDEHASAQAALDFDRRHNDELLAACDACAVLAVGLQPRWRDAAVAVMGSILHGLAPIHDHGSPAARFDPGAPGIWPDARQITVARQLPLDEPLWVYNLNAYREHAAYADGRAQVSGRCAYARYARIAGLELLRRGATQVCSGQAWGMLRQRGLPSLSARWDEFILMRYPQRRNLLAMIEGPRYEQGRRHREAALARADVLLGVALAE